jgi:hypothetical protein
VATTVSGTLDNTQAITAIDAGWARKLSLHSAAPQHGWNPQSRSCDDRGQRFGGCREAPPAPKKVFNAVRTDADTALVGQGGARDAGGPSRIAARARGSGIYRFLAQGTARFLDIVFNQGSKMTCASSIKTHVHLVDGTTGPQQEF